MYDQVTDSTCILQAWPETFKMNFSSLIIQYLPHFFQVDKETTKTAMELQKSSASLVTVGSAFEVGEKKPEINLECLTGQAGLIHQEKQPGAIKR